jgi:DNA mismatch repair ATPase MutS
LGEQYEQVKNFQVVVEHDQKDLHFLHRVMPGGTDKSYGIEVARLAGIPDDIIERAQEILVQLENKDSQLVSVPHKRPKVKKVQKTSSKDTDQLGLL